MADGEVEVEEPQEGQRKGKGKKERNWKDEETGQSLGQRTDRDRAFLWNVTMVTRTGTKKDVAYCQIDAQLSDKYSIKRDDYKGKLKLTTNF